MLFNKEFLQSLLREEAVASFYEDAESLGGILTSVAVCLPKHTYDNANALRAYNKGSGEKPVFLFSDVHELLLITRLANSSKAR